jgi:cell division protein FtsN
MPRRDARPTQRAETKREPGKRGGLFLGLLLGLMIGLSVAAGMAWYFNRHTSDFKPAEQAPETPAPSQTSPIEPERTSLPPVHAGKSARENKPKLEVARVVPAKIEKETPPKPSREQPAAPIIERGTPAPSATSARVPLTFYGILPGDKPAKPVEPPKPKELWWLQIAALKNPADADKLKARLSLLGLPVITQRVESAGLSLYRVRVGPYKRDEDAFADLDTLVANNYEPRLFKEPVTP